jgi:hypothetical protein
MLLLAREHGASAALRHFPPLYFWVVLQFYEGFAVDLRFWFCTLAALSAPFNLQVFLRALPKTQNW